MLDNTYDYIVVGAGIVGLATAYKLQLKFPNKSIAILEKEAEIGLHQTGRNSGVIHSGIYYTPNSYKAKNCRNGREQLVKFAKENKVNHDICGKLIVATTQKEVPILETIYHKGIANKIEGICYLNTKGIKEKEPFIDGIKAIWVPVAGIIDYVEVSKKFIQKISLINTKSKLVVSCLVTKIFSKEKGTILHTNIGKFYAKKVIFCTGLQSDRIAEKDGLKLQMHIVGFRGDYFELKPEATHKINNLVYPVPDPKFPFLGVHFTKTVDGKVLVGPTATLSFGRESYDKEIKFRESF